MLKYRCKNIKKYSVDQIKNYLPLSPFYLHTWFTGPLVHWFTCSLAHLFTGSLVHWFTGIRIFVGTNLNPPVNHHAAHTALLDKSSFEKLFKTHYSSLCSYANGFLKDLDAAEEVVQEIMVKVWMQRDSLQITTSIESYLFRSVRNGCMNVIRHIGIREGYKEHVQQEAPVIRPMQEEKLMGDELQRKIRLAIDALPMERRRVFIMSRYDGMTYQQIADALGISVKTVENQMGKALKSLRADLADYLPILLLLFDFFEN